MRSGVDGEFMDHGVIVFDSNQWDDGLLECTVAPNGNGRRFGVMTNKYNACLPISDRTAGVFYRFIFGNEYYVSSYGCERMA